MDIRTSGTFLKEYERGIEAIEDLHLLADTQLSPVIHRLHFHMSEIRRKAQDHLESNENFEPMRRKMKKDFQAEVNKTFRKLDHATGLNVIEFGEKIPFFSWAALLEVMPEAMEQVELINPKNKIYLSYERHKFAIRGEVNPETDFESIKEKTYSITRRLLKKNAIQTFKLENNQIILEWDLFYNSDREYLMKLKEGNFSLPCSVENFKMDFEKYMSMDDHFCLLLSGNGQVFPFQKPPRKMLNFIRENGGKPGVFHFPFLFRPVSLIIPIEGKVVPCDVKEPTGSEKKLVGQDVSKVTRDVHLLDLFSLLD